MFFLSIVKHVLCKNVFEFVNRKINTERVLSLHSKYFLSYIRWITISQAHIYEKLNESFHVHVRGLSSMKRSLKLYR